ncbi:hypothetical protein [Geodermatophilus amargosae]|uniref:hypothetical protein n=1 Tax=Geodermatophilus amargosae TaxID=1296565 RepID=UPI0034DFC54E
MTVVIRDLEDADVDAVVALSLGAWAPVSASFGAVLGPAVYRHLHPDRERSQAAAVEGVCRDPAMRVLVADEDRRPVAFVAVVATGGDPGHAPARRTHEAAGSTPLPLVRCYRML